MPSRTARALLETATDRHSLAYLQQLASHGLFDVTVRATGDTWIDDHHICEDIALALGGALSQVLSAAQCMLDSAARGQSAASFTTLTAASAGRGVRTPLHSLSYIATGARGSQGHQPLWQFRGAAG